MRILTTRASFGCAAAVVTMVFALLFAPSVAGAQEDGGAESPAVTDEQAALDAELREGATVYSQICASCHQAGGIGLNDRYPPLLDNDNVDDAAYVESVITNGRRGEIVVDGTTYNGIMPSFSTLSDEDTDAVIAFIQNDFVAPVADLSAPLGPPAGTELPASTNRAKWLAYLLVGAVAVAGIVLSPRIIGRSDRLHVPWLDAFLKTTAIVVMVILFIVVIPDRIVRSDVVARQSRFWQDLIGVSAWMAGLSLLLWGLWYAHRESRV